MVRDACQSQISFAFDKMKKADETVFWLNECAEKKILLIIGPNKLDVLFKLRKISASFHFIFLICCRKKKTCVDVHKIIYTICTRNANKLVTNLVFPMKFWLLCRQFQQTNQRIRRAEKNTLAKSLYRPWWWTNVNLRFSERKEKETFLNLPMIFDWSKAMRLLETLSFGYLLCIMTSMGISTAILTKKVYVANCLTKSGVEVIKNMKIS